MRAKLPWILLAISVALNVFVVGGFFYAKQMGGSRWMDRSPIMAAARELELTDPQKQALEKMQADIRRSSSEIREEMRPLRRDLLDELGKPQLDFDVVDRKIDDLGDVQNKRFKAMVRAVHEFQQSLTPQQQEQFRTAIRENMSRRGKSGDRGDRGDSPPARQ